MNRRALLAKVHIAKKELGLTDEEYRDALYMGTGKASSKDLTDKELIELIDHFKELGWEDSYQAKQKQKSASPMQRRFESLGDRPGMASPAQLRKIEATWNTNPAIETKTAEALNKFIHNRFGISALRFIERRDVGKILGAIEAIK